MSSSERGDVRRTFRPLNGGVDDEANAANAGQLAAVGQLATARTPHLLVEAKLAVPSVHHDLVDRPRIRRALDASRSPSLTLVTAPAGYGKTTAVRDWCAGLATAVAWVTLDESDNDPVLLWRYVATALDRVRRGLGQRALRRLAVAGSPIEVAVDDLMNAIASLKSGLVVVLDDLQTVSSEECMSSIDYALAHLPPTVRLVLVTRVDPPLKLARMRAAGALIELRGTDLAFTVADAHDLLVVLGRLELADEDIDLLVERTEGWPAALVLAWLWLRRIEDPAQAVQAFGGDNRFVADYLSAEVLGALDGDARALLQGAAVLGEFTAGLCDWVLDRTDSASRLAELEHSNLLISRLEKSGWFRIHSLFAEYAVAQLLTVDPAAPSRIHQRAAEWFRLRGLPVETVVHAAAAGDQKLIAEVLVEHHLALIRGGASTTLLRWVQTLPDELIVGHPELAVAAATAAMLVGGVTLEQRRLLQLADRAREGHEPKHADMYVESAALLVRAVTIDRGIRQAVLDGRRAVVLAETNANEILTAALAACARALFFAGELDEAWALAVRALEHPAIERHVPSLVVARATLALAAVESDRLASARGHAEKAKAAVGRIGTSRSWLGANASAAVGAVLASEGKLVEAEHELAAAEGFFTDEVATIHNTWLLLLLARVRLRRGRLGEAEASLRSARDALAEVSDSGRVLALADEVERELEIERGRARRGEMLEPPSEAELAVLRLLTTDLSMHEIAARLFLSENTIRSHRRALYHKLGVHSRPEAIARATTLGLLAQTQSPG